jgi:hypothetical protein
MTTEPHTITELQTGSGRQAVAFWVTCGVRVVTGTIVVAAFVSDPAGAEPIVCQQSRAQSDAAQPYSYERASAEETASAIRNPDACRMRERASVVWR